MFSDESRAVTANTMFNLAVFTGIPASAGVIFAAEYARAYGPLAYDIPWVGNGELSFRDFIDAADEVAIGMLAAILVAGFIRPKGN